MTSAEILYQRGIAAADSASPDGQTGLTRSDVTAGKFMRLAFSLFLLLAAIALPVALIGQIALLVGLVMQLDRLWHENRAAAAKLDNVDQQLHELKTTTTLLGTAQGPSASVFYSHFAGGASPQMLLTDLKGQLDLLAVKIAQNERSS